MSESPKNKDKYVYRMAPCPAYDIESTESWLTDMAKQGYVLSERGFTAGFAKFKVSKPCNLRYRLEASREKITFLSDNDKPTAESQQINAMYNWQYVATRGQFYIFVCSSNDSIELNTDPKVQSIALDMVSKREKQSLTMSIIWLVLYPLMVLRGNIVLTTLATGFYFMAFSLILVMWALFRSIKKYYHLRKVKNTLLEGIPLNHYKDWRTKTKHNQLTAILFKIAILVWVVFLLVLIGIKTDDKNVQLLKEYNGNIPFATIKDFEPNGQYELSKTIMPNTIEISHDFIAPQMIEYREFATIRLSNGKVIKGGLLINYYQAKSSFIAKQVIKEYKREVYFKSLTRKQVKILNDTNIKADSVYVYSDIFPTVIVQQGNKVIKATFYQVSESYKLNLNDWAQVVADSIK